MKVGQTLKIAAPKYVESHAAHLQNDLIAGLNTLLQAADRFNADLESVKTNKDLSPQGRATASVRVAKSVLDTLAAVEGTTIKGLTDRAAMVEASLLKGVTYSAPKDAAERIAHELQLQEIRGQLRELPSAERLSVYLTSTDPMVLAAVESAPMTLSPVRPDGSRRLEAFVNVDEMRAAMFSRAEAANPVAAQTLREVRSLREVYSLAVGSLRNEVLAEVRDATPEAVLTMS